MSSPSSQLNETNEIHTNTNLVNGNKKYFGAEASTYDTHPIRVLIAQKCAKALLSEVEPELDPEKSEVLDFACGTGIYNLIYFFFLCLDYVKYIISF